MKNPFKSDFKFALGAKVKDKVSGFSGLVIGRTQWLYNCARYVVQPQELDKDGKPKASEGFDEDQLVEVKTRRPFEIRPGEFAGQAKPVDHGGPMPTPSRRPDASRR
jgi:hypothetical protein